MTTISSPTNSSAEVVAMINRLDAKRQAEASTARTDSTTSTCSVSVPLLTERDALNLDMPASFFNREGVGITPNSLETSVGDAAALLRVLNSYDSSSREESPDNVPSGSISSLA